MTIKDIAKLSGVSVSTVSRVLNNRPDVSEVCRSRVNAVIQSSTPTFAVLSILDKPITFNSIDADEQLVDIAFSLFISPKDDVEKVESLLKSLTIVLSNVDLLNALRLSKNEKHKVETILNQIDLLLDHVQEGLVDSSEIDNPHFQ